MVWLIKIQEPAEKDLARLDKPIARRIIKFIRERLVTLDDPRSIGGALKGSKFGEFWKYRVGDYRIICKIEDVEITIYVVTIGNRREVYR